MTYDQWKTDSGYHEPTPEEERARVDERQCAPRECVCTIVIVGSVFTIYRCKECGKEEWL